MRALDFASVLFSTYVVPYGYKVSILAYGYWAHMDSKISCDV